MAQSAAERRSAQRRLARELHENRYERSLPKQVRESVKRSQVNFANRVMADPSQKAGLSNAEKNQLARMASYASWGRGNPEWEDEFKEFWYHDD